MKFLDGLKQLVQRDAPKDHAASSDALATTIGVGALLAQRYRLDAELGRGGMGVVFRAHDVRLDRAVALKVINLDEADARARERFLREAQITVELNHPHIVAVYATDAVKTGAPQPTPYIVMEYVQGKNLDQVRGLTYAQIVEIAWQICDALKYAHAQGLAHRNLKPGNVLVQARGDHYVAKLVDFGVARAHSMENLPNEGVAGTGGYVAPEVIAGQPADVGADLYALGVMLYEMVTGHAPFSDFDSDTIFTQHSRESVTPPSHSRPDVPPALESIILRLLAKDPQDRYASAAEVCRALDQVTAPRETARTNLPQPATSFVGRIEEIAQVSRLLESHRAVTLVGAGGIGKTRLALAVGAQLSDQFLDGVWLAEFTPWRDPMLVPQIIASALGVREESRRMLVATLAEQLRDRNLLLIFDQCEHLRSACAQLAQTILRACPAVRILTTSRESLNISGEAIYHVAPLSTSDAEQLFIERIGAATLGSQIAAEQRACIARICRRVDALPLAVELAAARVAADAPTSRNACGEYAQTNSTSAALDELLEQVAAQLENQWAIQSDATRSHEQTLGAVLDWSYRCLDAPARALCNRLSVFVGGCTSAAVESFSGAGNLDATNSLAQGVTAALIDPSPSSGATRYYMPESIRQFALAQLQAAGEEETMRRNHRDDYLLLALQAEPNLHGSEQGIWRARLETEYANLLSALDWTISRPQDAAVAFRFGGALWQFWNERGYWRDGRERLAKILALPYTPAAAAARLSAQIGAGYLALRQADDANARELLEQGLALARASSDQRSAAYALCGLGWLAQARREHAQAQSFYHAGWEQFQGAGNPWESANALFNLGATRLRAGDHLGARTLFTSALAAFRAIGAQRGIAQTLTHLGVIAYHLQQYDTARARFEEGLPVWRGLRDSFGLANLLVHLGYASLRQERAEPAREFFGEGLALFKELRRRRYIADALYGIAGALALQRQPERAAQVIGAADALLDAPGAPSETAGPIASDREWIVSRIQLEPVAFQTARAAGRAQSLEQAIAQAME